jgi:hypothetical protein
MGNCGAWSVNRGRPKEGGGGSWKRRPSAHLTAPLFNNIDQTDLTGHFRLSHTSPVMIDFVVALHAWVPTFSARAHNRA